jgi:hypothetical protein
MRLPLRVRAFLDFLAAESKLVRQALATGIAQGV